MTKGIKRTFFYSAVAVFLLLSYIIILYAQGYKYSFSERKFQRTGAISLKANTDAKIYIDDKLEGNTSFFNNSFSIDRLLPGKYQLTVQKDNYSEWKKIVIVEEGLVVDFPSVMILPEDGDEEQKLFDEVNEMLKINPSPTPRPNISPTPSPQDKPFTLDAKIKKLFQNTDQGQIEIADNVKGFSLSKNKNKIAWWTNNEIWIMWLNDTNYQPFYKKGDKELITRFSTSIQNGYWFRDEDHVILELERFDSKNRPYSIYQIIEIDKRGGVNIIEL